MPGPPFFVFTREMSDSANLSRSASCPCGALTAICRGEPQRISLCHCNDCKRRSGSAFALQATYPDAQVVTSGAPAIYKRINDEGRWARFYFCATCGTTVWYRIALRPEMVSIPIGCFGTPDFPPPAFEVFDERTMRGMTVKISPEPERQ